ncbi:MAG: NADH-quinone oxidoreductase subunit J [Nitrospira sp.]|nr:NADH-quinone oxidoreductase subunit J [Nitrospira sp.]MBP6607215.1 NADH-quinone oxidoreductase subunit J [Nitrospira sp.]
MLAPHTETTEAEQAATGQDARVTGGRTFIGFGRDDGRMDHIFFFYFAAVIAGTSILVVALRNPVYSALSLLIMFFHVAGLYITLHAEFLAAVQIVVYAGAILVLYLFVVMLLSIKSEERYHNQLPVAGLLGVVLCTEVILLVIQSRTGAAAPAASDLVEGPGNTEMIGEALYSTYLFPFEVASLILLVAMIGAIILAKKDINEPVQ